MRPCHRVVLSTIPCLISLLVASGCSCSSAPQRQPVYGKIASQREVKVVTFQPSPDLIAPAVTTEVVNGNYQFTRHDGPIPGAYKAVFTFADTGGFGTAGSTKKEFVQPVPGAQPLTPQPPPELPITVPAAGSLEINITLP